MKGKMNLNKDRKNKLLNALLLLIVLFLVLFNNFPDRFQRTCSGYSGTHYNAYGYISWIIPRNWSGGRVTFANPNLDYSVTSERANHTIWVTTSNSTDSWVEAGYSKGWNVNGSFDPGVRTLYTGRNSANEGYAVYRITTIYPGSPGTTHTYEILYSGGLWKVYIDSTYVAYSNQPLYAKEIDVGLKSRNYSNSCPRVYPTNMQYYYEGQGWYSFGQANPSTYTNNSYYCFQFTNPNKDSGVDWNYFGQ